MVRPEEVGALAGLGFYAPGTTASIYLMNHQWEHAQAVEQLRAVTPNGVHVEHTSNGGLLFFGYTKDDEQLLIRMASAFAGDE
jgi:hypothetical protein